MSEPPAPAARGREPRRRVSAADGSAPPRERSRTDIPRREAALSLAHRIALFDALSRDAAWARAAVRIR